MEPVVVPVRAFGGGEGSGGTFAPTLKRCADGIERHLDWCGFAWEVDALRPTVWLSGERKARGLASEGAIVGG